MGEVLVIQFPGVNCEYETLRALDASGLRASIFRWNDALGVVRRAAALVLPGGFSYQDRIRAGVVAAKDSVVDEVYDAASRGVPVMGICNGAQILVEAGIVPGFNPGRIELALAPNKMSDRDGYYCTWIRVKKGPAACLFTEFLNGWEEDGGAIPLPVAHAEGRFTAASPGIVDRLGSGESVALYYAREGGKLAGGFPENPNGSIHSIAAVTNAGGNVLAIMPHPERASWCYQIPLGIGGHWGRKRAMTGEIYSRGPGRGFFDSLKRALS